MVAPAAWRAEAALWTSAPLVKVSSTSNTRRPRTPELTVNPWSLAARGAVAFAVAAFEPRDCRHETSPPSTCFNATIRLRRLPLSTRRDRAGGPLVPALRPLLPRRRGAAHRARGRGRPCHRLPLGAALHAATGRRRQTMPPHRWGPMVCGRDVCEGRRQMALRLPGDRSVRPGDRCVRVRPTRR